MRSWALVEENYHAWSGELSSDAEYAYSYEPSLLSLTTPSDPTNVDECHHSFILVLQDVTVNYHLRGEAVGLQSDAKVVVGASIRNGWNTVSRALSWRREVTEFGAKLSEFCGKLNVMSSLWHINNRLKGTH